MTINTDNVDQGAGFAGQLCLHRHDSNPNPIIEVNQALNNESSDNYLVVLSGSLETEGLKDWRTERQRDRETRNRDEMGNREELGD